MRDTRPTVCSVFAGTGGLDIGLERAGFRTVAAIDSDPDCIATLHANQAAQVPVPEQDQYTFLHSAHLLPKKIEAVGATDLRTVQAHGSLDLMAGGPPCQPFSSSGTMRSLGDPRGRLFEHFVRLAELLRPRLILFENVRGLITAKGPSGEPGEALFRVKGAFESIGYATRFALLNAADFGCPQRRVRCFMLAARAGEVPAFPEPTHAEHATGELFEPRHPWLSLRQFLLDQPEPDPAEVVRPTPALAAQLASLPDGTGLRSAGARETTRPGGHWGYRQGTFIADQSLPARTVTASASQDWIRLTDGTLRRLTWRECAALQGFPPTWRFVGGKASLFRQIGNAVPVVFGMVLGRVIRQALSLPASAAPRSAPLPAEFVAAINYTKKENRRNGDSRVRIIRLQSEGGIDLSEIKGVGSAEG